MGWNDETIECLIKVRKDLSIDARIRLDELDVEVRVKRILDVEID